MLVAWTNISRDVIEGVQGRYFIPALPLVAFLLRKLPIRFERDIEKKIIILTLILNSLILMDAFECCIQKM